MRAARVARRAPTSHPPVVPTRDELLQERHMLLGKEIAGKGFGVFARRDIPPWTPLCVYPGHVYSVNKHHDTEDPRRYALSFFRVMSDGAIRRDVVVDPSPLRDGLGSTVDDAFAGCMAPRLNEPSQGEAPNVVWVMDVPAQRIFLYSYDRGLKMGEELLIHYGSTYPRTWQESTGSVVTHTRILFDGPAIHAVSPNLTYLVLHAGMTTCFDGDSYEYPLDRVHPEGWYDHNDALRAFVRRAARRRGKGGRAALFRPAKRFRDDRDDDSDAEDSDGYIEIVHRVLDHAPLPPPTPTSSE